MKKLRGHIIVFVVILIITGCSGDKEEVASKGASNSTNTVEDVQEPLDRSKEEADEEAIEVIEPQLAEQLEFDNFNEILLFDLNYEEVMVLFGEPTSVEGEVITKLYYESEDFEFSIYMNEDKISAFEFYQGVYHDINLPADNYRAYKSVRGEHYNYGMNRVVVDDEYCVVFPWYTEAMDRLAVVKDIDAVDYYIDNINPLYSLDFVKGFVGDQFGNISWMIGDGDVVYEEDYTMRFYHDLGMGLRVDPWTETVLEVIVLKDNIAVAAAGEELMEGYTSEEVADGYIMHQYYTDDIVLGSYMDNSLWVQASSIMHEAFYHEMVAKDLLHTLDDSLISYYGIVDGNDYRCDAVGFNLIVPDDYELELIDGYYSNIWTYHIHNDLVMDQEDLIHLTHMNRLRSYRFPDVESEIRAYIDATVNEYKGIGIVKALKTNEKQINIDGRLVKVYEQSMKMNGEDLFVETYFFEGEQDLILMTYFSASQERITAFTDMMHVFEEQEPVRQRRTDVEEAYEVNDPMEAFEAVEVTITPIVQVMPSSYVVDLEAVIAKFNEAVSKDQEWFNLFVQQHLNQTLPYHEKMGVTEEEYQLILESFENQELVELDSFNLTVYRNDYGRLIFGKDERLGHLSGMVFTDGVNAFVRWEDYMHVKTYPYGEISLFDLPWSGTYHEVRFEDMPEDLNLEPDTLYGVRKLYYGQVNGENRILVHYETDLLYNDWGGNEELSFWVDGL